MKPTKEKQVSIRLKPDEEAALMEISEHLGVKKAVVLKSSLSAVLRFWKEHKEINLPFNLSTSDSFQINASVTKKQRKG